MVALEYTTTIKATPEQVWQTLWNDDTYRKWTVPFMEGSYVETSWKEGDRIAFLAPGNNGMFGVIEKKIDNKEMVFRHEGEIKNGVDEKMDWKEATEGYHLSQDGDHTHLKVIVTMEESKQEFQHYFDDAFPKALAVLKDLCEK